MTRPMTMAELMRLVVEECDSEGGIRPWAIARDLHPSIIDKFIAGQRGPAPQLLEALGMEKVTMYRRK